MKTSYRIALNSFGILLLLSSGCGNNKEENTILASGTIESVNVTVSSKSSGQIKKFLVNEGDQVKAGDLLAEIDHDLLDIQLRQAVANVELANAQLKLLISGAREEDIKLSEDNLKQSKINLDQAKIDKERMLTLYDAGSVTKKQLEDAEAKYDITESQYNSSRENLKKIRRITRPEEIEQSRANLKRAISASDLLKQNIEDCKIYAPVNGIISKKYVEEGEIVNPNSSLLKLSNLETVNLMIYVNETELGKVKLGEKAEIKIDTYKDKLYEGKIIFISRDVVNVIRNGMCFRNFVYFYF